MRIKRPRQKNEKHLKFIRGLPCMVCGDNTATEAAHVRMHARWAGKHPVGKGEKPDDKWVVPMCGKCHRRQHEAGEAKFWYRARYHPIITAALLWAATGDHEMADQVIEASRRR